MMYETLKAFGKQFEFDPVIVNSETLTYPFTRYIVAGMGGSNLVSDLIALRRPDVSIVVHRNYGLPNIPVADFSKTLCVASSYSGNTEETIDAFQKAGDVGMPRLAITTGGKLLALAKEARAPYIQLPDAHIEPRTALGFSMFGICAALGLTTEVTELRGLAQTFQSASFENSGKQIADTLKNKIPVIYASEKNKGLAYAWKIAFNETAKIPAFYNVFPELNHNEMIGFDVAESTKDISKNLHFIFLRSTGDHPRIQKRMEITEKVFRDRGFEVSALESGDTNVFSNLFASIITSYWSAYFLAKSYGVDPDGVPLVESFKQSLG